MVGRAAYQNPEMLLGVDPEFFGEPAPFADAFEAVDAYLPYVARELARGARLHDMTRHMLGLFAGRPGARAYRQSWRRWRARPRRGRSERAARSGGGGRRARRSPRRS